MAPGSHSRTARMPLLSSLAASSEHWIAETELIRVIDFVTLHFLDLMFSMPPQSQPSPYAHSAIAIFKRIQFEVYSKRSSRNSRRFSSLFAALYQSVLLWSSEKFFLKNKPIQNTFVTFALTSIRILFALLALHITWFLRLCLVRMKTSLQKHSHIVDISTASMALKSTFYDLCHLLEKPTSLAWSAPIPLRFSISHSY